MRPLPTESPGGGEWGAGEGPALPLPLSREREARSPPLCTWGAFPLVRFSGESQESGMKLHYGHTFVRTPLRATRQVNITAQPDTDLVVQAVEFPSPHLS